MTAENSGGPAWFIFYCVDVSLVVQAREIPRQLAASIFVDWKHRWSSSQHGSTYGALLKLSFIFLFAKK